MPPFAFTTGQQAAFDAFLNFLFDPDQQVFVIGGYAGTGKTTMVKELIARLPGLLQAAKLINPSQKMWEVALTATTNQAADTFARLVGEDVRTIHSFLGLRVHKDYSTGETNLVPKDKELKRGYLLFIDEASFVDSQLLGLIFRLTDHCKIVFMGDPAQIAPVKSTDTPVFNAGFPSALLTEVMRQGAGSPITDLATKFRETVTTGEFFSFKPDGEQVIYLDRPEFEQTIINEFTRPDWKFNDSKFLAWTNKCVIAYNQAIRNKAKGDPDFQPGDYAVCNKYLPIGKGALKTDQLVYISDIRPASELGVMGNNLDIDGRHTVFMPNSREVLQARIAEAKRENDYNTLRQIDQTWIDLRAAYACTIDKSQGSTYDQVFIDLDDLKKCHQPNRLARMLYVGTSRARHKVYLTGDIV